MTVAASRTKWEPRIVAQRFRTMTTRFVAAVTAVLLAFAGGSYALAQQQAAPSATPAPASTAIPNVPKDLGQQAINALGNIVRGVFGWSDSESIGTVTYFHRYDMQVKMQLDRYREIHLHQGTVINPRGWTIKPGDMVDVKGRPNADGSLNADMIVVKNPH